MRTANITLINEETSALASITKAISAPLVPKAKYPFPYSTGIFGMAAKRYKPAQAVNVVEGINAPGVNLAS